MIRLFSSNDKTFTTNGDIVIKPLKAKVHKEDNGSFYLDLETSLDYVDDLTANRIVVANTPQGSQAFRITNVEQTRKKISAKCHHVFYDSNNYLIADSYVVDKNCNDALDHLNNATDNTSPFTTVSDVTSINSFRCVRKSLYEAIQTVIERWGGHLVRDNYTIAIRNAIGKDNGVVVRYAKNLKEINCEYNWDNVVTKLMPVGKDGLLLDEKYVYSNIQYDIPYTKCVSFEQNGIEEDDYKDADGNLNEASYKNALMNDLRTQAQDYVNANCKPSVNYKLKANLEKITDVGDTIVVKDERLGLDITTNVIAYDYDCILERYTELEFGNFKQKLSNLVDSITSSTQQAIQGNNEAIKVTLSDELKTATDKILSAMSSSYVIYEGDKILVVDALPKEEAHHVIMINSGGIAFSSTGINGAFKSAWTIDNVLNMEQINVINLTADLIKGGTLKLGSNLNQFGTLEIYDEANNLIGILDKNGLRLNGVDDSYIVINNEIGFAGYDRNGNKIYWVSKDEFHQKKSVVEEEITLCNKMRFIPITLYDDDGKMTNDGIGLVSTMGGD
nr:MAG TPA: tail protein [Caudoviricetes sp.]